MFRMIIKTTSLRVLLILSQVVVNGYSLWIMISSTNIEDQSQLDRNPGFDLFNDFENYSNIENLNYKHIKVNLKMTNYSGKTENKVRYDAVRHIDYGRSIKKRFVYGKKHQNKIERFERKISQRLQNRNVNIKERLIQEKIKHNRESLSQGKQNRRQKREESVDKKWSWSVTLYATKTSEYTKRIGANHTQEPIPETKTHSPPKYWCTGSLVGRHWILTSAHCVDTKAWHGLTSPQKLPVNITSLIPSSELSQIPVEPTPWGMNAFSIPNDTNFFITPLEFNISIGENILNFIPKNGINVFYHNDYVKYLDNLKDDHQEEFCYQSWGYFKPDLALLKLQKDQTSKAIRLPKGDELKEDFFYGRKCFASSWNKTKLYEESVDLHKWSPENGSKLFDHSCIVGNFHSTNPSSQAMTEFARMNNIMYFHPVPPNNKTADMTVIYSGGWLVCEATNKELVLAGQAHSVMTSVGGFALPLTEDGKSFKADEQLLKVRPGTVTARLHYRAASFAAWVAAATTPPPQHRGHAGERAGSSVIVNVIIVLTGGTVMMFGVLSLVTLYKFSKKQTHFRTSRTALTTPQQESSATQTKMEMNYLAVGGKN